ncbi:MAG TPA: hypothetical protein VN429_10420 [Methanospirillum sp.]|uniref:hypothetical protein n=1 Tax=Methanospirillum sp. TaxID=45200 RepID=UPI002BE131A1|nr:hypothetical protein [Methanospirillum sp.]HWQ64819.1 hypothetical protein [Methanospirillum sp.]
MTQGNLPKYFSFTPEGCYLSDEGFKTHWNKQEAIDRAQKARDEIAEHAWEGWLLEVEEICWGEIRGQCQQIHHKETPGGEFDYSCDYVLRKVKRPKAATS